MKLILFTALYLFSNVSIANIYSQESASKEEILREIQRSMEVQGFKCGKKGSKLTSAGFNFPSLISYEMEILEREQPLIILKKNTESSTFYLDGVEMKTFTNHKISIFTTDDLKDVSLVEATTNSYTIKKETIHTGTIINPKKEKIERRVDHKPVIQICAPEGSSY